MRWDTPTTSHHCSSFLRAFYWQTSPNAAENFAAEIQTCSSVQSWILCLALTTLRTRLVLESFYRWNMSTWLFIRRRGEGLGQAGRPNFAGLVLGSIDADHCDQTPVGKCFARSANSSICLSNLNLQKGRKRFNRFAKMN